MVTRDETGCRSADRYYAELSQQYDEKIRQLVPRYDEMMNVVLDLVTQAKPGSVIDIGVGTGALDAVLLEHLPSMELMGIDASAEMVALATPALRRFGNRARVVLTDVRRFRPPHPVAVVLSNLVLHNLSPTAREALLADVHGWLAPGGTFVWGDLIRLPGADAQRSAVAFRRRFALAAGCDPGLVEENFRKEGEEDCPMTTSEMLAVLQDCDLEARRVEWTHDTFAVVAARRTA
jgi:trans-aconitate methyltransferase